MSDTILDAPASYLTAEGNPYEPKNYSLGYRGTISLSEALAGSVNVPAVKIVQEVGVEKLLDFVRSLGVTSLNDSADHYGLALTLGVGEISLWELMRGYTIFADQGRLHRFSILENTPRDDGKLVTKPEAISQIVTTLTSHRFKSEEFPTGSALDFGEGHVFVKTGTSRNFRDNYALGFTEHYLIGVWTGNKDGSNMRGVSGASGAGEIFAGIVNELGEAGGKAEPEIAPPIKEVSNEFSKDAITITSPLNGTRYRKDPDTPADRQDVTVKYWSKRNYGKVTVTLYPESRPNESRVLRDGRIPVGNLPVGDYAIRVTGTLPEGADRTEVRFSIE